MVRNIPQDILEFEPDVPVQVDRKCTERVSPGPGGCTHEHLRILVDEADGGTDFAKKILRSVRLSNSTRR